MNLRVTLHLARIAGLTGWSAAGLIPAYVRFLFDRDRAAWLARVGAALARLCERCGPAAIKLAQIAAARGDLLPPDLIGTLARVHDAVRPPGERAIRRVLAQAYGPPADWPFEIASWVPVASGSIAVVLDAHTSDRGRIAIKLLRRGIAGRVDADLRAIDVLLGLVERRRAFRALPLSRVMADLAGPIRAQCDLAAEAESARRLHEIAGPQVVIALPIPALSGRGAMAMAFVPARHQFSARTPDAIYRPAILGVLHFLYRMIFIHGFLHCDLHPGNVAIADDGRPIVYDYGLVAELAPRDRRAFAGLFGAIRAGDGRWATDEVLRVAACIPPGFDRRAFEAGMVEIVARWSGRPASEFLVAALVRALFELQYRHGVVSVPGFASAVWALATFEGLIRARCPDLDFQAEARPFLVSQLLADIRSQRQGGATSRAYPRHASSRA